MRCLYSNRYGRIDSEPWLMFQPHDGPMFVLNWYARCDYFTSAWDDALVNAWTHETFVSLMDAGSQRYLWELPLFDLLRGGPRFADAEHEDRWHNAWPYILMPNSALQGRVVAAEAPDLSIWLHIEGLNLIDATGAEFEELMAKLTERQNKAQTTAERIADFLMSFSDDQVDLATLSVAADAIREGRWKGPRRR